MSSCCGGSRTGCGASGPIRDSCNYFYSLVGDPCYGGLCCTDLPKISYKPFIPSWEIVRQRPRYSEKNVWHVWKVFGNNMDKRQCCRPDQGRYERFPF